MDDGRFAQLVRGGIISAHAFFENIRMAFLLFGFLRSTLACWLGVEKKKPPAGRPPREESGALWATAVGYALDKINLVQNTQKVTP
jgi:hypothetical protein